MKKILQIVMGCMLALCLNSAAWAVVVTFDDLDKGTHLSGTTYMGINWEPGVAGYAGKIGYWSVPSADSTSYPVTGNNIINAWGTPSIGMRFSGPVDVNGAYFAGQGKGTDLWTIGVRVHGFLGGLEIHTTDWFIDIDETPSWFAMNLIGVDRIVIEAVAVSNGGGWYGMDNLTYNNAVPIPGSLSILFLGLAGLTGWRRKK